MEGPSPCASAANYSREAVATPPAPSACTTASTQSAKQQQEVELGQDDGQGGWRGPHPSGYSQTRSSLSKGVRQPIVRSIQLTPSPIIQAAEQAQFAEVPKASCCGPTSLELLEWGWVVSTGGKEAPRNPWASAPSATRPALNWKRRCQWCGDKTRPSGPRSASGAHRCWAPFSYFILACGRRK